MNPRSYGIVLFLIFSCAFRIDAQCYFACNGQVNVALDIDCEVDVTLNMLIQGSLPDASCNVGFTIEDIDGTIISEPGWYAYTVENGNTGTSCSGYLLVEDKLPPEINCECETYLVDVDQLLGTLDFNSPIYVRPAVVSNVGCESGSPVDYEVFEFGIESNGSTNFQVTNLEVEGTNFFLSLYENCFDPTNPCENLIAIDGDGVASANISMSLESGINYYLVVSHFINTAFDIGDFHVDASVANGNFIIKNPHCIFRCTDLIDTSLLQLFLPELEEPYDNCNNFITLEPTYAITDAGGCGGKLVTRSTGYVYNFNTGYQLTEYCEEQFLFEPIQLTGAGNTIDGLWEEWPAQGVHDYYFPEREVILPCGSNFLPGNIADYYDIDTPETPSGPVDDYVQSPVLVENNEGIPFATPYYVTKGFDGNYHAAPLTNNTCNLYVTYQDYLYDLCGAGCYGNSKITRTWNLIDWCKGTNVSYEQLIKITDIDGPDLTVTDFVVSVDPGACYADILMPAPDHIYDDCDNETSYWVIGPNGIIVSGYTALHVPVGVHIFTYYGQDCCGNQSTAEVKVTVRDDTSPVAITTEDIVIQLTSNYNGDGTATLYAENVDNHSYDGCTDVKIEIRRTDGNIWCHLGNATFNNDGHADDLDTDNDNGEFVKFCCEDLVSVDANGQTYGLYEVRIRVWDDGDGNGIFGTAGDNYNEAWTNVRVEDKLVPTVDCPEHIEIDCSTDFNNLSETGEPIATGACFPTGCDAHLDSYQKKPSSSAPFVGEEIPAYNPTCREGAIKRTWYCGGSNCLQWIIVRPSTEDPLDIEWPSDQTVDCLGGEYGEPVVTDDLCQTIGTSLVSDTFYFQTGTCFKILNRWSVINWCQYDPLDPDNNDIPEPGLDDGYAAGVQTHTQVIRLFDSIDPILEVQDTTISANVNCVSEDISLFAVAEDNGVCGTDWLKWEVEVDLYSDWEVDYVFSTDLMSDDPYYLVPTMDTMYLNLPDGIESNCSLVHRVHWKVEDGCGNFASKTQYLTIKDLKKPTPYCLNLSTALMQNGRVELWARDFDTGSFDNCTDDEYLIYTFSSNVPPQLLDPNEEDSWYNDNGVTNQNSYINGDAELWNGDLKSSSRIFDCDDIDEAYNMGGVLPVSVYVWDLCGNYDYCVVNLEMTDNDDACGLDVPRALISGKVETSKGDDLTGMMMNLGSDIPGYPKENMTDEYGYFSFESNPMYVNYILTGSKNDDWLNGVTTLDLVLIQKHILGTLALDNPYKIIAADANNDQKVSSIDLIKLRKLILGIDLEITNNTSWRLVPKDVTMELNSPWPFDEMILLEDLVMNEDDLDFIAIKTGDVNESAIGNISSVETDARSSSIISLRIDESMSEEGCRLEFFSNENMSIAGFQFALSGINKSNFKIESGQIKLTESNYSKDGAALKFSWNSNVLTEASAEEALFSITYDKSNHDKVSLINNSYVNEIYTDTNLKVSKLLLKRSNKDLIELYGIQPNPLIESANISFWLANEQDFQLEFSKLDGVVLHTISGVGTSGVNQIEVNKSMLKGHSGIVLCRLKADNQSMTKKAIVLN